MSEKPYEPSPRCSPFAAAVGGKLYVWGGGQANDSSSARAQRQVEIFDPYLETWSHKTPTGIAPRPGLLNGACASSGDCAYAYGGKGKETEGTLHKLDTRSLVWSCLSPRTAHSPIKKTGSRMVVCEHKIVMFGGQGVPSGLTQPGASYASSMTNELHTFDLNEGKYKLLIYYSQSTLKLGSLVLITIVQLSEDKF